MYSYIFNVMGIMCIHFYVCMYVYVCMSTRVCAYICMYVHMCVCMYSTAHFKRDT